MTTLPRTPNHVGVPPIKCQGIKTKLIPFIFRSLRWQAGATARWVEPFLGSGAVVLNLAPERALLADTNMHVIQLYTAIQSGEMTKQSVQAFLTAEGRLLSRDGADHYYAVRDRFNENASPFDFLFLNRSCFNGVMRFNRSGGFNVPFGHKPHKFSPAYVTKVANQVGWAAQQMRGKAWEFRVAPWIEVLADVDPGDFVYLDPPYVGRHADYYNTWQDVDAAHLATVTRDLSAGFALSMWLENRYRRNEHIQQCWSGFELRVCSHFYHVGSTENLRNEMDEALIIKPGFATADVGKQTTKRRAADPSTQMTLTLDVQASD